MLDLQRLAGNAAVARAVQTARHEHGPACGHTGAENAGPADQRSLLEAAMAGPSRPLSGSLLDEAESFYNNKLSATRLHDDPTAQRAVAALGAHAMTVGTHVFLGPTANGRKDIIGHELGHVDKNLRGDRETGRSNAAGVAVTDPGQASERTAEADGVAFAAGAKEAPSVAQRAAVQGAHTTAPTVQRFVRRSERRGRIHVSDLRRYFHEPRYRMHSSREGGNHSTVTLGPRGYSSRGTDANSRLPGAIRDARDEWDIDFKAGHLLNSDFGGTGSHSENLTILTPSANRRHQSFDNPLKDAAESLRDLYEVMARDYYPVNELSYGIYISVQTSPDTWKEPGTRGTGKYITNGLICEAEEVGLGRLDDMLLDAREEEPDGPSQREAYRLIGEVQRGIARANTSRYIDNRS